MPIPTFKITDDNYIRVDIGDEVIRARINSNDFHSRVNRSFLSSFGEFRENSVNISLPIECNNDFGFVNFKITNNMPDEITFGKNLIERFGLS